MPSLLPLAFSWPVQLERLSPLQVLALWGAMAVPVVWLGMRSLAGLGPTRKWVAIGTRLLLLLGLVLLLADMRWQRENKDLDLIVLRDTSESILNFHDFPGESMEQAVIKFINDACDPRFGKKADDRVGVIEFSDTATITALPNTTLTADAKPITTVGGGTDLASAIQLALATFRRESMHRLVVMTDGNTNMGDTEAALAACSAQHVPVDVIPLRYTLDHEIVMDKFVAPSWRRENVPFTLEVFLRSTNLADIPGTLNVTMTGGTDGRAVPVSFSNDPTHPGKRVIVKNGLNRYALTLPGQSEASVYNFRAAFEPDPLPAGAITPGSINATVGGTSASGGPGGKGDRPQFLGDTNTKNNYQEGFVIVRGQGKVLLVDNTDNHPEQGGAKRLINALTAPDPKTGRHLNLEVIPPGQFPKSLVQLQAYDAIILSNVPQGPGGLDKDASAAIASYVQDMGGGLVVIGGPDAYGAGGWSNTDKLVQVLPVDMDVPAQRKIPKGALVCIMHSCEMPNGQGNYWAEQCALQAIATLGSRDEVGLISYNWGGGGGGGANGIGGAQWDYVLQEKGDGSRVVKAAKAMQLGDMPSFDDAMNLALNGANGGYGLAKSDARQKHVIIISDGDPQMPVPELIAKYKEKNITVSTVTIYTHSPGTPSPTMIDIAKQTQGQVYGPVEDHPDQLPQIFIKEATTVRRSLINEANKPPYIPVDIPQGAATELIAGIGRPAIVRGMVLTSKKNNPNVNVPLLATNGDNRDPLLAYWQAGLGRAVAWTSDAHNRWGADWVASPYYDKFWQQVVNYVSRPPMSSDFEVETTQANGHAHVRITAQNKDTGFLNFLNVGGKWVGPDMKSHDVRPVQTGPGTYEADFDAAQEGNYAVMLNYSGAKGVKGSVISGVSVSSSPEQRDLSSNEAMLHEIADRTGGRILSPWDPAAQLFTRQGIPPSMSPLPVWDILLPLLLALLIVDVAIRRIAWDWKSTKRAVANVGQRIGAFFGTRKVETRQTLDALQRVRAEAAEGKLRPGDGGERKTLPTPGAATATTAAARPDRSAKFEARGGGSAGDLTEVVGGASAKPIPAAPKKIEPKGGTPAGSTAGSLMEAKRRAQQQIREKEQGGPPQ